MEIRTYPYMGPMLFSRKVEGTVYCVAQVVFHGANGLLETIDWDSCLSALFGRNDYRYVYRQEDRGGNGRHKDSCCFVVRDNPNTVLFINSRSVRSKGKVKRKKGYLFPSELEIDCIISVSGHIESGVMFWLDFIRHTGFITRICLVQDFCQIELADVLKKSGFRTNRHKSGEKRMVLFLN